MAKIVQEGELDDQPQGAGNDVGVDDAEVVPVATGKYNKITADDPSAKHKLTGMYKNWFLDYASYVILERAVPDVDDGLKPVQRRILHTMRKMDDGRYNKVANVVGETMKYHPHGDSSIADALVQLGQKDLLIDCQGNWGNILTGDSAAASRYIEARLSKFALEVVFNPKTTEWRASYDGRNQEPVALPVKFPLLLAQGVEGIAVGLASKILPHNFIELIDASIAHLKGESFVLMPDFQTGGMIDCSKYNDGLRGGNVKVRARIAKIDKRTLAITEIPFGTTTESIKESIIKANDKGKIKIKKVDDNTADKVEIIIHVSQDESSDKTIDALYAFTDCEVSISPNSCVIVDNKPHFMAVSDILRHTVERTKELLRRELEIRMEELDNDWHSSTLEKIFIEKRIYHDIEGVKPFEKALDIIENRLQEFLPLLRREITKEDILRLTEIRIKRITGYEEEQADKHIKALEREMKEIKHHLGNLTAYAIAYYERIKGRYSEGKERRSEIREFDSIEATKVVVANAKLYVDRAEGFFGIGKGMKDSEFVCDCSDIDDVIAVTKEGKYIITKVVEKAFFEKDILYIGVFKRNDERTIYNILYRDGKNGAIMMKRCAIKGITRDKVYDLTKGTPKSEILYMSVNQNGEAEVLKVYFRPRPRLKKLIVDLDFSQMAIKSRQSQGNMFTRYSIHKIVLKERGTSTLAGQNVWYDEEVRRLNSDGRGELLGEFIGEDKIIVFNSKNQFYTTGYDLQQHFPEDTVKVEKLSYDRVYSVVYWDDVQKYYYLKRFNAEVSDKMLNFIDEEGSMVAISVDDYPRLEMTFKGAQKNRPAEVVDVEQFIAIKSHRAKGKRLTTFEIDSVAFIEPFDRSPQVDDLSEQEPSEEEQVDLDMTEIDPEVAPSNGQVEFTIERPEEEDKTFQLDLFL